MDIIVDIDGTLADGTHRQHFIKTKPKNWPAYQAGCPHDRPIPPVINIITSLWLDGDTHRIVFCSGRSEEVREETYAWLLRNFRFMEESDIRLYMRKAGDYRRDDIIKLELLEQIRKDGFNPVMAFDDRPRVLRAWRSAGIFTFNVQQGEEDF